MRETEDTIDEFIKNEDQKTKMMEIFLNPFLLRREEYRKAYLAYQSMLKYKEELRESQEIRRKREKEEVKKLIILTLKPWTLFSKKDDIVLPLPLTLMSMVPSVIVIVFVGFIIFAHFTNLIEVKVARETAKVESTDGAEGKIVLVCDKHLARIIISKSKDHLWGIKTGDIFDIEYQEIREGDLGYYPGCLIQRNHVNTLKGGRLFIVYEYNLIKSLFVKFIKLMLAFSRH